MLQACTSIPVEQRADRRAQIYNEAQDTIEKLIAQDPSIATKLENAAGYFVSQVSAAHVAVLGGGQGMLSVSIILTPAYGGVADVRTV